PRRARPSAHVVPAGPPPTTTTSSSGSPSSTISPAGPRGRERGSKVAAGKQGGITVLLDEDAGIGRILFHEPQAVPVLDKRFGLVLQSAHPRDGRGGGIGQYVIRPLRRPPTQL